MLRPSGSPPPSRTGWARRETSGGGGGAAVRRRRRRALSVCLRAGASALSLSLAAVAYLAARLHTYRGTGRRGPQPPPSSLARRRRRRGGPRPDLGGAAPWSFDPAEADRIREALLRTTGRSSPPLTAYVEPPLPPPPPAGPLLPVRTHSPSDLVSFPYPAVSGCSSLPGSLPTFHPPDLDAAYGPVVNNRSPLYPRRTDYAACCCPVDADPLLPWLHDAFPTGDGRNVELVAANKRLCNTDPGRFGADLDNLEGQVTLMQPVPVRRLSEEEAAELAPGLWRGGGEAAERDAGGRPIPRYRLASLEDADADAGETRFICRFHAVRLGADGGVGRVVLGETLSRYPFNPELANLRKASSKAMLTPSNDSRAANEHIWNAVLRFRCPVPDGLRSLVASGRSVVGDAASVYLDLVPIRTRPRRDRGGYIRNVDTRFRPEVEWGAGHVLPRVEASGRWANIPICRPPVPVEGASSSSAPEEGGVRVRGAAGRGEEVGTPSDGGDGRRRVAAAAAAPPASGWRRHFLVGCVWASALHRTRGADAPTDDSTPDRLMEWLAFQLHVAGFDHVYVYDNTGAHVSANANATSLRPVTDLFPPDRVTRVSWPHRSCNNNRPAHANAGKRTSQHAAEASCLARYGPHTEWMASFDVDEYFVPAGGWPNITHWLGEGVDDKTQILSFFMTRASPDREHMEPHPDGGRCGTTADDAGCLAKRPDVTYLEAYNCDRFPPPKPDWGWRAQKQIYRPDFVLSHYVHYSLVTRRLLERPSEASQRIRSPRPYERRVNELTEAFLLHAKTRSPTETLGWRELCSRSPAKGANRDQCYVGIAWPVPVPVGAGEGVAEEEKAAKENAQGMRYNCYRHRRITEELAPRLRSAMAPYVEKLVGRRMSNGRC